MGGIRKWFGGAAIVLALPLVAGTALIGQARAADYTAGGLHNETAFRHQHMQEFIRAHSDTTGKFRPDLIKAASDRTSRMQVAPTIGAHPPKLPPVTSTVAPGSN
jgi:hypothetical protein